MIESLCEQLIRKKAALQRHSIYFANEKERDFELFVFIDTGSQETRPDFLQELYQVLMLNDSEFANPDHKKDLKEWLGVDDSSSLLTPLNWVKIAIDRYPYRLLVVIDPEQWKGQNSKKTPLNDEFWLEAPTGAQLCSQGEFPERSVRSKKTEFLYKRICWIDESVIPMCDPGRLKLWFFQRWIIHIMRRLRGIKSEEIFLFFNRLDDTGEKTYFPNTLPMSRPLLENIATQVSEVTSVNCLKLCLSNLPRMEIVPFNQIAKNSPVLFFSRHGDLFSLETGKNEWKCRDFEDLSGQCYYSQNLSGSLSYFTQLLYSLQNPLSEKATWFFMGLAEQGLLRVGIADERFQEWMEKRQEEVAASIFQARVLPLFWKGEKEFGQRQFRSDGLYGVFGADNGCLVEWGKGNRGNFDLLWREDQRDLDIIIIHQGILDKSLKKDKHICTQNVLYWKERVSFFLVTSGRGVPENIPEGVKFLPYGGIEACMVGSYFDKFYLFRQLMVIS